MESNQTVDRNGKPWPSFDQVPSQKEADFEYFSVLDTTVGHFRMPFPAINEGDAKRQFVDLFRGPFDPNNPYMTNPEHYQVFRLGYFWKKTGKFEGINPEHVANVWELRHEANRLSKLHQEQPQQADLSQIQADLRRQEPAFNNTASNSLNRAQRRKKRKN